MDAFFTVNQAELLSEHSLFYNGPSSSQSFGSPIAAMRDKCINFNLGGKCDFPPCTHCHVCSQPGCKGPHPSSQCPQAMYQMVPGTRTKMVPGPGKQHAEVMDIKQENVITPIHVDVSNCI